MSSNYPPEFNSMFDQLARRYGGPAASASPDVRQSNLPAIPQGSTFANVENANNIATEGLQTLTDQGQQQQIAQPIQELSHRTDRNGQTTVTAKISGEAYDYLQGLIQDGQSARNAFSQARQLLAQKQAFLQQNPIVAGLGAIASQAAARYAGGSLAVPGGYSRIAPLVQAAGAFGLSQFGQTPEQLAIEQAKLSQEGLQAQEPVNRAILGQQEIANRQESLDLQNKALAQQTKNQDLQRMLEYRGQIRQAVAQGLFSSGDEGTISEEAKSYGLSDKQASDLGKSAVAGSNASKALAEINRKQQLTLEDIKEKSRLQDLIVTSNAQIAKMMAMFQYKKQEEQEKLDRLNPVEQKTVTSASQGLAQLDELDKLVKENPRFFGAAVGRIPQVLLQKALDEGAGGAAAAQIGNILGFDSADMKKMLDVRANFANGVNLVRGYGAGSYGFRPTEYKMLFEPLIPSPKDYAEGVLSKTQGMRNLFNQELQSTALSFQARGGRLESNPILKKLSGGGPQGTDTSDLYQAHIKSLPKGATPLSLTDFQEAATAAANGQLKVNQHFNSSDGREWVLTANGPQPVR